MVAVWINTEHRVHRAPTDSPGTWLDVCDLGHVRNSETAHSVCLHHLKPLTPPTLHHTAYLLTLPTYTILLPRALPIASE